MLYNCTINSFQDVPCQFHPSLLVESFLEPVGHLGDWVGPKWMFSTFWTFHPCLTHPLPAVRTRLGSHKASPLSHHSIMDRGNSWYQSSNLNLDLLQVVGIPKWRQKIVTFRKWNITIKKTKSAGFKVYSFIEKRHFYTPFWTYMDNKSTIKWFHSNVVPKVGPGHFHFASSPVFNKRWWDPWAFHGFQPLQSHCTIVY